LGINSTNANKKKGKRERGRERGERGREEDLVPLGPFRVISLEEGLRTGRGSRRKLLDTGKSIL
jgi:hypothetical protein